MENYNNESRRKNYESIQKAKEVLRNNGYFVDSLWQIDDVRGRFKCSEEEANIVLDIAFDNDTTYEQIWLSIDFAAEELELERKMDEEYNKRLKV